MLEIESAQHEDGDGDDRRTDTRRQLHERP
jgi:hypothetical protein